MFEALFRLMRTALFLFVVLSLAAPALAAGTGGSLNHSAVVLLDASASMRGFFNKDSICPMVNDIERALEQTQFAVDDRTFKFDKGGHELSHSFSSCETVVANGQVTLIDRAYSTAIQPPRPSGVRPSTIWVITDNVQDPQGHRQEDDDIRQFYNVLEQSAEEVQLFIRTPDFSGPLYGKDGSSTLKALYQGPRGLLIYAILIDPSAKPQFETAIDNFENKKATSDPGGVRVKGFQPIPAEMELEKAGDAEHLGRDGRDDAIVFDKVFSEREKIKCSFQINFRHGPDNLVIDQATVNAKVLEPFQLYVGHTRFDVKEPQLHANPPRLSSRIIPRGAKGASSQAVQITMEFPEGVEFPHSSKYLWSYLWQPRADIYKGKISVGLRAKKANMDLAPDFIDRYNAGDEYFREENPDQSKIYGLQMLFRELNSQSQQYVDLPARTIPIEFSVSPPLWPLAALISVAVMLFLLLLLFSRALIGPEFQLETLGPQSYRLSLRRRRAPRSSSPTDDYWGIGADNGSPESLKAVRLSMLARHLVKEDGSPLGELRRSPLQIQVRAASGYTVNGGKATRLPREGGPFSFTKLDEAGNSHQQTFEPRPRVRQHGASVSDSFFDS